MTRSERICKEYFRSTCEAFEAGSMGGDSWPNEADLLISCCCWLTAKLLVLLAASVELGDWSETLPVMTEETSVT